ncbi:MAG TPA: SH3 domain-containing protein [Burkholderiales bacterium]|nr:SH3 domain-containing protein [Burkholderiales bacterium]
MRFLSILIFLPSLAHAEPATLVRAADLKAQPASDAATVSELAASAAVDAGERSGGWVRVKTQAGAEGWVKMLALRYGGPGAAKRGDSGIGQAVNVARSGSSGTQVTTGVRGLDENDLKTARPNPAELKKLQGYAESKQASSGFAENGKLKVQRVEYPK